MSDPIQIDFCISRQTTANRVRKTVELLTKQFHKIVEENGSEIVENKVDVVVRNEIDRLGLIVVVVSGAVLVDEAVLGVVRQHEDRYSWGQIMSDVEAANEVMDHERLIALHQEAIDFGGAPEMRDPLVAGHAHE